MTSLTMQIGFVSKPFIMKELLFKWKPEEWYFLNWNEFWKYYFYRRPIVLGQRDTFLNKR